MKQRHDSKQDKPSPQLPEQGEQIELSPFYHDLRNKLVRPEQIHVETRYFFRKWKSRLGPTATILVMELRDRCYYNPQTQERRDTCWPALDELAEAIGVSARTIQRLLDEPLVQLFIQVEHRYRYDDKTGRKVRTSSLYRVAMDDPLLPEDQETLDKNIKHIRAAMLEQEIALRHQMQSLADSALPDNLSYSTGVQHDRMSGSSDLNDNLSATCNDNLSPHEELPIRGTHTTTRTTGMTQTSEATESVASVQAEYEADYRSSQSLHKRQVSSGANAGEPAPLKVDSVVAHIRFEEANGRLASAIELRLLGELEYRYGSDWVAAAIDEAVASGSSFVAPKRIRQICERWKQDGFQSERREQARQYSRHGLQPERAKRTSRQGRYIPNIPNMPDTSDTPSGYRQLQMETQIAETQPVVAAVADHGLITPPPREYEDKARPVMIQVGKAWMSVAQLWQVVLQEASCSMNEQQYTWLRQARLCDYAGNTAIIGAPGAVCHWLEERLDLQLQLRQIFARLLATGVQIEYRQDRQREAGFD